MDNQRRQCNITEFTCDDGICIAIDKRCNNINDCLDKSDEAYCAKVHYDKTYQKFIVPPPLGEESRANVSS